MPFLSAGRYVANVVDGKATLWRKGSIQRPARMMKPK